MMLHEEKGIFDKYMNILSKIIVFCGLLLIVQSKSYAFYPSTLWSSDRISQNTIGVRVGPVVQRNQLNIVTLSRQHLTVYQRSQDQLIVMMEKQSASKEEWMKLTLFDLDRDGLDEIIVSGFRFGRVQSSVYRTVDGKLKLLQQEPFYLQRIQWKDSDRLFAQKSLSQDDFTGPLLLMEYEKGKFVIRDKVTLGGALSVDSVGLYQVQGFQDPNKNRQHVIYLSPVGKLVDFEQSQDRWLKRWTSGQIYGGAADFVKRDVRDVMNQLQTEVFAVPPQFEMGGGHYQMHNMSDLLARPSKEDSVACSDLFKQKTNVLKNTCVMDSGDVANIVDGQIQPRPRGLQKVASDIKPLLYVMRNEGYLKSVVGSVSSIKSAQMIRLEWTGYGFQETWNSPRLDGAISDFTLVDWDGDGKEEILASFLLRDRGYLDTLKKQDSLLIVLKPQ